MMRRLTCLSILLACGTLPAVAAAQAQPAQATPTTPSTTQTPSQPASTATPPASSTTPAHSSDTKALTEDEKKLISKGYHLEVRNGEKNFCRREPELGSHFERKVCGTPEQLRAITATSREITESTQRYGTNPTH